MAKVKFTTLSRTIYCFFHEQQFFEEPIKIDPLSHIDLFAILANRGDENAMLLIEKFKRPQFFRTTIRKELTDYFSGSPTPYLLLAQQLKGSPICMPVILKVSVRVPDNNLHNCSSKLDFYTNNQLMKKDKLDVYDDKYPLLKEFGINHQMKWYEYFR